MNFCRMRLSCIRAFIYFTLCLILLFAVSQVTYGYVEYGIEEVNRFQLISGDMGFTDARGERLLYEDDDVVITLGFNRSNGSDILLIHSVDGKLIRIIDNTLLDKNYPSGVIKLSDGNFLGMGDYAYFKFNRAGTILWVKNWYNPGNKYYNMDSYGESSAGNGCFYIGLTAYKSRGGTRYLLVHKFDNDGNFIWESEVNSSSDGGAIYTVAYLPDINRLSVVHTEGSSTVNENLVHQKLDTNTGRSLSYTRLLYGMNHDAIMKSNGDIIVHQWSSGTSRSLYMFKDGNAPHTKMFNIGTNDGWSQVTLLDSIFLDNGNFLTLSAEYSTYPNYRYVFREFDGDLNEVAIWRPETKPSGSINSNHKASLFKRANGEYHFFRYERGDYDNFGWISLHKLTLPKPVLELSSSKINNANYNLNSILDTKGNVISKFELYDSVKGTIHYSGPYVSSVALYLEPGTHNICARVLGAKDTVLTNSNVVKITVDSPVVSLSTGTPNIGDNTPHSIKIGLDSKFINIPRLRF